MSIKFNDTQLVLLSAASQREDHCLVPPTGPKRAKAQRAAATLLEVGLVKEIRAKAGADTAKAAAPSSRRIARAHPGATPEGAGEPASRLRTAAIELSVFGGAEARALQQKQN